LEAALCHLIGQRCPFNNWLRLELSARGPKGPQVRLEMRQELVGNFILNRLHGGIIASVLDVSAGLTLMMAAGHKYVSETPEQIVARFARLGTVDLRVDYLTSGLGEYFIGTTEITRLGGRLATTQMRLVNEAGTLISTGSGCFTVD
jgi:uncharacterized protein (TIGR00369 family)